MNHPSVKANLDISHLVLARISRPSTIEKLRGKIGSRAHFRLRRQGPRRPPARPGGGRFPALSRRDQGDSAKTTLTISIELEYSPEPDRIVDWVKEAYDSTSRLMRAAGLRRVRGRSLVGCPVVILALVAVVGWPLAATVRRGDESPRSPPVSSPPRDRADEPSPARSSDRSAWRSRRLGWSWRPRRSACPIGIALAFVLFRTDIWGRRGMLGVVALAAFVPMPLIATAWMGALGNAGRSQALGLGVWLSKGGRARRSFTRWDLCRGSWHRRRRAPGGRARSRRIGKAGPLALAGGPPQVTLRRSLGAIAAASAGGAGPDGWRYVGDGPVLGPDVCRGVVHPVPVRQRPEGVGRGAAAPWSPSGP